jgi:hypothetical protein
MRPPYCPCGNFLIWQWVLLYWLPERPALGQSIQAKAAALRQRRKNVDFVRGNHAQKLLSHRWPLFHNPVGRFRTAENRQRIADARRPYGNEVKKSFDRRACASG